MVDNVGRDGDLDLQADWQVHGRPRFVVNLNKPHPTQSMQGTAIPGAFSVSPCVLHDGVGMCVCLGENT